MACVILPSETARLVYGYLVKENLNDIALQFLESSPYLMDCCQIVKSGFQFNTKLMGKDLPELLQEYSVIHNLVNNKISHICKNSLLYKRIKLRCESLPEILELILFWKYRKSKSEENSTNSDKTEKSSNNPEINTNCEYSNLSDVSQTKICENSSDSSCFNKNKSNLIQKDGSTSASYHSKLSCETYVNSKEPEGDESATCNSVQKHDVHCYKDEKKNEKTLFCVPVENDEVLENVEKTKVQNFNNLDNNGGISTSNTITTTTTTTIRNNSIDGSNYNNTNNNNFDENHVPDSKFNNNSNILSIGVDTSCEDLVNNGLTTDSLVHSEEPNRFENPIKIVGIEGENPNENHPLEVFSKPMGSCEENMNLENSSVVFVNPDVGDVTINQEQSQIIVIPFDYYKPENGLVNDIGIDNNKDLGLISNEVVNQQKNDIIFGGENAVHSSSVNSLFSDQINKNSHVDENIVTENDFLKNRNIIYNIEKELYKSETTCQPQVSKESKESLSVQAVSAPVIVVSQPVPARPARYRAILPKKKKSIQVLPVVVHPLLENNKDLMKISSISPEVIPEKKVKREVSRRVRKKGSVVKKSKGNETKEPENFSEISTKTSVENIIANENNSEKPDIKISPDKEADIERTNEEKENLEKNESKKNETPVFMTKRNSKRLSLSTPRRKSHIRVLEFETPPKTNEDKKKAKTSPKVKVEPVKVERKSVRNTLFKSPIPEDTFKSPVIKKVQENLLEPSKPSEPMEPLNEMSIPIATRSPNTKLSDAWENLTGVGCVIGQNDLSKISPKKMWDADLRCFIMENSLNDLPSEKKRIRKPEKNQKDNRKSSKKKMVPPKRIKPTPVTVSPSKMSLTAKRNTYSINGNDEGSPIRTLIDDLKIVTPFKDIETIRPTEETPLTKLLRENINTIDIDLSMINTPSFPPTPSIVITPDLEDACMTNYYSPTKDCLKEKVLKITDYFKSDSEKTSKKETKEMHEKVIDDLVSKAKEIIGLGKEGQEENAMKRRPSGKILSMVKIQMLTQCDKKLMENIPINEETTFSGNLTNQTIIGNVIEETAAKTDLKIELEEKRKRALKKIKVVKENLSQTRNRVTKRGRKRRKSGNNSKSDKSTSDISKESLDEKQPESGEGPTKDSRILHSTPYAKRDFEELEKTDSDKKMNDRVLEDIRQQFPPFQNDVEKYPELSEKSRKKLHYVEHFLKLTEIVNFINEFNKNNPPKLFLKPSLRRFFHVFYKWLKHPHKRELNASPDTNALLKEYLLLFDKVNLGLNRKNKFKRVCSSSSANRLPSSDPFGSNPKRKDFLSDDDEKECKLRRNEKRKDEDIEDGVVSTLPLKKRKSTVQQVENKTAIAKEKNDGKNTSSENASQTQNFLQDIDVDRFLSQIHGQETR